MNNLLLACRALRAGESLADSATWKNRQLCLNAILAVLYLLVKLLPMELAADDVDAIASSLAFIGGTINSYLTAATSDKVGV